MEHELCDWCGQPGCLHSLWDDQVCESCEMKMIRDIAPEGFRADSKPLPDQSLPDDDGYVRHVATYWRVVCYICGDTGPGAQTPGAARVEALKEEFIVVDDKVVCRLCEQTMLPSVEC